MPVDIQMCNIVIDSTDHSSVIVWPKIIHIISGLTDSYMSLNVWTQTIVLCIMRVVLNSYLLSCNRKFFVSGQPTDKHTYALIFIIYSWNIKVSLDWMTLLQFSIVSLMILNIKNTYTKWVFTVYRREYGHSVSTNTCNRGTFIITVMTSDRRTARAHNLITNLIILSP